MGIILTNPFEGWDDNTRMNFYHIIEVNKRISPSSYLSFNSMKCFTDEFILSLVRIRESFSNSNVSEGISSDLCLMFFWVFIELSVELCVLLLTCLKERFI